jgi:DNA polymerase
MTAEQKIVLAAFLDTAAGYLGGGYVRRREAYAFTGDIEAPQAGDGRTIPEKSAGVPGVPMDAITAQVSACAACGLSQTRIRVVPGEGPEAPLAMIIGEGPGADEDESGRPFVGRAGQLLDKMLASIGLYRDRNCFIANVVKCRPPGNRDPGPEEIAACSPFLEAQIKALKPKAILCAGRVAARHILQTEDGITRLRGSFGTYTSHGGEGAEPPIPVLPTYHPSAILRDDGLKRPAFDDLKLLMVKLVSLDAVYAAEVRPLLVRYAESDEAFAARVKEYLV